MILWIDAQLSPSLAPWLSTTFTEIEAFSVRWLGFQEATDIEIFMAAREAGAVVKTLSILSSKVIEAFVTLHPSGG
jgi:predicted nuclease of predicted toxin-antitoxin system